MQSIEENKQLAPLKLVIPGKFYDCQIYRGKLYVWTLDGSVQVYNWNKIVNHIVMPKFQVRLPFVFGFLEGNFLYNKRVAYVFWEESYRSLLLNQYQSLVNKSVIISAEELATAKLQELDLPMSELPIDTEVYANNIYFTIDTGLFRRVLHLQVLKDCLS